MNPHCPIAPTADLSLADQVRIEALAKGRSRECARQLSATVKGPGAQAYRFGDRIKAIAAELDRVDEIARRNETMARLATPSGLIQRMRADWPGQSAAVKAYAQDYGLDLGEAWAEIIAAGVEALTTKGR